MLFAPSLRSCFWLGLFLALAVVARAEPRLDEIVGEMQQIDQKRAAEVQRITAVYIQQLRGLEDSLARKTGQLDQVLRVREERQAREQGRTAGTLMAQDKAVPGELRQLRQRYEQAKEAAGQKVQAIKDVQAPRWAARLEQLEVDLTMAGKIDDALKVRAVRSQLKVTVPKPGRWPADAVEFRGRHFKYFGMMVSWESAKARCAEMGGRLALARGPDMNEFLYQMAKKKGADGIWMDATDAGHEGKWLDGSGTELRYTHWRGGQPNNYENNEHYAALMVRWNSEWNDYPMRIPGRWRINFICEWP